MDDGVRERDHTLPLPLLLLLKASLRVREPCAADMVDEGVHCLGSEPQGPGGVGLGKGTEQGGEKETVGEGKEGALQ